MWNKIIIKDWNEFNQYAKDHEPKKWVYRGHSDVDWPLMTSFQRAALFVRNIKKTAKFPVQNRNKYEKDIIDQFKSQYHLYLSYSPDNNADLIINMMKDKSNYNEVERKLEWLSLMQHYGVPTRLLDWTFSPYVALFFALENALNNCCVYFLDQNHLQESDNLFFKSEYKDLLFGEKEEEKLFIRPYEPYFKNERLVKQQGLFLVPSSNFKTFDSILSKYENIEGSAIKLIIPKNLRHEFLLRLKRINITHETLFPGIDGFCRSLKFSLLESADNLRRLK